MGLKGIVRKVCNVAGNTYAIAETRKGDHFLPGVYCASRQAGEKLPLKPDDQVSIQKASKLGGEHISTNWSIPPKKERPAR